MKALRATFLLLSATLLLAGCGQRGGLLPEDEARALLADIDRIESAIQSGDCASVPGAVADGQQRASELPSSVDRRLRARIEEGFARLTTLAPRDCLEARTTTTETTTTATTQTTQTSTTATQTTPAPTQTTPAPQPTQTTPAPQPTQTTPPQQTTPPPSGGTPSGGGTGGASPDTGGAAP